MVKAYAELVKKRNDLHLLIAGNDEGGHEAEVRKWVSGFNISDKVTFTGILGGEKKKAALSGSDIFVLSSYSENFGIAVIEAMASGLPVVVSDQVGIYNDVSNYRAGVVVSCNVNSLKDGILKVIDDDSLRGEMRNNAKALANRKFGLDEMVYNIMKMFEQIMISH